MDNKRNPLANTCPNLATQIPPSAGDQSGLRREQLTETKINASNSSGEWMKQVNRVIAYAFRRRKPARASALSAFDGSVVDYRGVNG